MSNKPKGIVIKDDEKLAGLNYSEVLIYTADQGKVKVEILLQNENLWLTQVRIAQLFNVDRSVVTKHLKNIFDSRELNEESNVQILHIANSDKPVKFYNLDTIISVGYRVNSTQATLFRIWATERLKEYIIKGFTMDDERLKEPNQLFGKDYFEEQLERIRAIRASERRFYQKITDIYSRCSADYEAHSPITQEFFANVQNKLHYAITSQTAAEIVYTRADSKKPNMALETWKNAPSGSIRKADVSVAKNYLTEKEIDLLNKIVTMFLDYAELQAEDKQIMYMQDWVSKLNEFLKFNRKDVLENFGTVAADIAKAFAEQEFQKYSIAQDKLLESDFDKLVKGTKE